MALIEKKVIGWCDISSFHRETMVHSGVLGLGVIAPYRHQGIGRALLERTLTQARTQGFTRIELTVRQSNQRAIALYKKIGFVIEGLHRKAVRINGQYENQLSMALLYD